MPLIPLDPDAVPADRCLDCAGQQGVRDVDTLCDTHYRRQEAASAIGDAIRAAVAEGVPLESITFEVSVGLAGALGLQVTTLEGVVVGVPVYRAPDAA